jgi:pimeloyl-ACP methyl ester carboxylesterase
MTMNAKRRRAHAKLAALPGVRPVRRPIGPEGGEFDLYYVRAGRKSAHPVVIIPGGPGAASVALYRGLRRRAAADGLDVIMVEHRGVGMSRHDDAGADLPAVALTIERAVDDIAAVLDDAQVEKATIYGTSYGTYLAAGLGVRHPDRVHAMILDSPLLSADDIDVVRQATRRLLWDGDHPETAALAPKVRRLVDGGILNPAAAQLAVGMYGLAGPDVLRRQLDLLLTGHDWLWGAIGQSARLLFESKTPYRHEPDLVQRIGYRELNYGAVPDGRPLDPAVSFREMATVDVDFEAEPFDLIADMPKFTWPTCVISGARDLTTPPAIARRIVELIPDSVFVEVPGVGHSLIDTKERAALDVIKAVNDARINELPCRTAQLGSAPDALSVRLLLWAIGLGAVVESAVPAAVPRMVRRVAH